RCDSGPAIAEVLLGAQGRPGGKLSEAAGGTLFLGEIGALPPDVQTALARHIAAEQSGRRPGRGDVRIIAATSRRLVDLVAAGDFNEELFNRLNVFPIWMPPLRDRKADIPGLAR